MASKKGSMVYEASPLKMQYIKKCLTLPPPTHTPFDYVSPQAFQDFVKNRADILWFEQEEDVFPSSKVDEMLSA